MGQSGHWVTVKLPALAFFTCFILQKSYVLTHKVLDSWDYSICRGSLDSFFDFSTFLYVEKKPLHTWSHSNSNSGRLAPCTLYLLTL